VPAPRRRYPTDLTDQEWALLAPLIPLPKPGGPRPPRAGRGDAVLGALGLRLAAAAPRLPAWQTVYHYWRAWRQGRWERVLARLREQERLRQGRTPTPSAVILDSQSVKTTERGRTATTAHRARVEGPRAAAGRVWPERSPTSLAVERLAAPSGRSGAAPRAAGIAGRRPGLAPEPPA
jgi:transposase